MTPGMAAQPRSLLTHLLAVSFALVACGRSGLDAWNAPDGDGPTSDAGATPTILADVGPPTEPSGPPPPLDDAGVPAPSLCDLAPPLGRGCPPTAPPIGRGCTPPNGDPSATCVYSESRDTGPTLVVFTCTLLGEDLIGWKRTEVPCARACLADAGGTLLDVTGCAARETVPCQPRPGETVQSALDDQIFTTGCVHHEGAGGFAVHFDSRGCATGISGGTFSACDVAALASKRFACAEDHPCAVAPTLVK